MSKHQNKNVPTSNTERSEKSEPLTDTAIVPIYKNSLILSSSTSQFQQSEPEKSPQSSTATLTTTTETSTPQTTTESTRIQKSSVSSISTPEFSTSTTEKDHQEPVKAIKTSFKEFFSRQNNANLTKSNSLLSDALSGFMDLVSGPNDYVANRRKSQAELACLENIFIITKYPTKELKHNICNIAKANYKAVTVWYQNKRNSSAINKETTLSESKEIDYITKSDMSHLSDAEIGKEYYKQRGFRFFLKNFPFISKLQRKNIQEWIKSKETLYTNLNQFDIDPLPINIDDILKNKKGTKLFLNETTLQNTPRPIKGALEGIESILALESAKRNQSSSSSSLLYKTNEKIDSSGSLETNTSKPNLNAIPSTTKPSNTDTCLFDDLLDYILSKSICDPADLTLFFIIKGSVLKTKHIRIFHSTGYDDKYNGKFVTNEFIFGSIFPTWDRKTKKRFIRLSK